MSKQYVKIIKNFISDEERQILNFWTLSNYPEEYFRDPTMDDLYEGTRYTTRGPNEDDVKERMLIEYPKEAYDIRKRIIEAFDLEGYRHPRSFYDGIVNGIGFENGNIFNHIDPIYFPGTNTLHCNIVTQKPHHGGNVVINDVEYDVEDTDLMYYMVSKHYHSVTRTSGLKHRILWVYGFCIPDEKMEEIFK